MKTGNTPRLDRSHPRMGPASMEPGHEDREYGRAAARANPAAATPQWSPAMKTGNTPPRPARWRG